MLPKNTSVSVPTKETPLTLDPEISGRLVVSKRLEVDSLQRYPESGVWTSTFCRCNQTEKPLASSCLNTQNVDNPLEGACSRLPACVEYEQNACLRSQYGSLAAKTRV